MELGDFVGKLRAIANQWPHSSMRDVEGSLAGLAERRLFKIIGQQPVLWAECAVTEDHQDGTALELVVFTEQYVVTDKIVIPANERPSRAGATRVVPWSDLGSLTLMEYWEDGPGSQTEAAYFTVHMADGRDLEIKPAGFASVAASVKLWTSCWASWRPRDRRIVWTLGNG